MDSKEVEKDEIKEQSFLSLNDVIRIFLKRKKVLGLTTLVTGIVVGILIFFVVDPIFLSSATVKTSSKGSGLSGLLSGGAPDLGNLDELGDLAGGGSVSRELALYETILFSRRCVEEAIVRFNIMDEENFSTMFDALKYFRTEVMVIEKDKIAGTMDIGAFHKDPAKAKEIANFLIEQLNKINTEMSVLNARNNREFIENRYKLAMNDMKKAEDSLKNYQDIFGISPDLTVQAAIKAEVEIESQIASEEVKLDLLRKILSPDQAEIKAQQEKISALREQLSNIANSSDGSILSLKDKPDVIMGFLRLKRNVEIQNKIVTILLPMFEQAKIEENRNTPSVIVLDYPQIPDKKTKPKRLITILLSMAAVFFVMLIFYIVKYKWEVFRLQNKDIFSVSKST